MYPLAQTYVSETAEMKAKEVWERCQVCEKREDDDGDRGIHLGCLE